MRIKSDNLAPCPCGAYEHLGKAIKLLEDVIDTRRCSDGALRTLFELRKAHRAMTEGKA